MDIERPRHRKQKVRRRRHAAAQVLAQRCADFLRRHGFTEEQFNQTGLKWEALYQVREHHAAMLTELQTTATYVVERLQTVPAVHSLKSRIKDPEHLVEKIIRKRCERPDFIADCATYEESITDLVGIRVLHLFKGDWRPIHDFIKDTWELHEDPVAYVRAGDAEESLTDADCRVETHPFGYRSIHYVIKSRPAKRVRLVELQVRTIFEEGWAEIDHKVRYPRQSDDSQLAVFLNIFNLFAGTADEMGTFTKSLATNLREQAAKAEEGARQIQQKETELQATISQLKITKAAKESLQGQISEINSRLRPETNSISKALEAYSASPGSISALAGIHLRVCGLCGRPVPLTGPISIGTLMKPPICPDCAKASVAGALP